MGWDFGHAENYYKNGTINRKAECDTYYTWENEKIAQKVVKSAIVANVYYAAVERTEKETGKTSVSAVVCLMKTCKEDYFNFGTKGMAEDMGPCYYECPLNILNLLTETDNRYATEWREKCRKMAEKPRPSDLPVGTVIKFWRVNREITVEKYPRNSCHKRPYWVERGIFYVPQNWIPRNYEFVENM